MRVLSHRLLRLLALATLGLAQSAWADVSGRRVLITATLLFVFAASVSDIASADVLNRRTGERFDKIQDAINDAQENDTLIVSPGRYPEVLSIRGKHLTLIGGTGAWGSEQPVIAPGPGGAVWISEVPRSEVDDVIIQNFTFDVSMGSGHPAAVNVEAAPVSLIGNRFLNASGQGWALWAPDWCCLPHWVWLYGNVFDGFVKVAGVTKVPVWIQYNSVRNAPGDAFMLKEVEGCLVEGNEFINPESPEIGPPEAPYDHAHAITLNSSKRCILRGNVTRNVPVAIYATNNEQVQIECNDFQDDQVRRDPVRSDLQYGGGESIELDGNTDLAGWDNGWFRFLYGMVDIRSTNTFLTNNIDVSSGRREPANVGVSNESPRGRMEFAMTAHGNWWDDETGPRQSVRPYLAELLELPAPQGSKVLWREGPSSEVFFQNWLTAEPDLKAACDDRAVAPTLRKGAL